MWLKKQEEILLIVLLEIIRDPSMYRDMILAIKDAFFDDLSLLNFKLSKETMGELLPLSIEDVRKYGLLEKEKRQFKRNIYKLINCIKDEADGRTK